MKKKTIANRRRTLQPMAIVAAWLAVGCMAVAACNSRPSQREARAAVHTPHDTLYTEDAAMSIYVNNPQRALLIIDSAEVVGNVQPHRADYLRACVYAVDRATIDTASTICYSLLAHDSILADMRRRAEVLDLMVIIAHSRDHDEELLERATQLAQINHELGDVVNEQITRAQAGAAMARLGREEEGLRMIDGAISKLDGMSTWKALNACIVSMKRKIYYLMHHDKAEQAIPLCNRILEKLQAYEEHPEAFSTTDKTCPGLHTKGSREEYIDFYRTQSYAFLATAYAALHQDVKVHHYAKLFDQTSASRKQSMQMLMGSAWLAIGDYQRMLDCYARQDSAVGGDTITRNYLAELENRSIAMQRMGRLKESNDLLHRYVVVQDSMARDQRKSDAQEYAARFHEREQLLLQQQTEERTRLYAIACASAVAALLLAIGFALYYRRQRHVVAQKNRALTRQIMLAGQLAKAPEMEDGAPTPPDLNALSNTELYEYLRTLITTQQLHLDPLFGRTQLVDSLHISKERVGQAFAQGSSFGSLTAFVNECRLSHSVQLLVNRPSMSIDQVARASGFANATTFGRNFKAKYAMTPTEFREQQR